MIIKVLVLVNIEDCIEDGFLISIVYVSLLECGVVIF